MNLDDLRILLAKPRLQIGEIVCSLALKGKWQEPHLELLVEETLRRFSKMADESGFALNTDEYVPDLKVTLQKHMEDYFRLSQNEDYKVNGLFIVNAVAGEVIASPAGNKYNPLPWIKKEYRR